MSWWRPDLRGRTKRTLPVVLLLIFGLVGTAPAQSGPFQADAWSIRFEDQASEVGIEFQHAGAVHDPDEEDTWWPAYPEIMGGGACWGDFTGDGYEDLYVTNQRFNEENPYAQGLNDVFDPMNRFYVNDGEGGFVDHTVQAGVESRKHDQGCSAADRDADGDLDLLVYGHGHVTLFNNEGDGTFTDVTMAAGMDRSTDCLPYACFHTCSAWTDHDADGDLDVFLCTNLAAYMDDNIRNPGYYSAQYNVLFRNEGDGTFTEVAEEAGVQGIAANDFGSKSLGAVWFDPDLDGWPDLYVANDMTPNEFYWNNRDGTFTRDDEAGLYDERAGMGVTSGDVTGDGLPDLYFTHYSNQHNGFYENRGDGTFLDRSGEDGLASDWEAVGWGTFFADLDRDGWKDLVAVNGHTEWQEPDYDQPNLVYRQEPGDGGTKWVDVSEDSGDGVVTERVSRGAAFSDYDLDGDVDFVIVNNANQSLQFLKGSGASGGWVYVQPVQHGPNPQAVGARVVLEAGGKTQVREVQAGSSYMSQDTLLADFGVGDAQQVDRITVHWPGGVTSVVEDVPVDRVVRVDRGTEGFVTDTLSPLSSLSLHGEGGKENWFRSEVEVRFDAVDRAIGPASGIDRIEHRVDEGPWSVVEDHGVTIPAQEGRFALDHRSVDRVGNVEPFSRVEVRVDLTPPVPEHEVQGTYGANGWWLQADLHLDAVDALSGVDEVRYRIDGGPWEVYGEPVQLLDGVHHVEYKAVDRAGNEAPVQDVVVKVDATVPEVDFVRPAPGTVYAGDEAVGGTGESAAVIVAAPEAEGLGGVEFSVHVSGADATSGVAQVGLWLDGERVAGFLDPGPEVTWVWNTTQSPMGTHLLQVVAQDRAGNVETDDRFVVLVSAAPEAVQRTLEQGASLYPIVDSWWP